MKIANYRKFIRCDLKEIDEDKIVFYDVEANHQFAPYAKMAMCAAQYGINSTPFLVETKGEIREFKRKLLAPDVMKVDFNGVNYDTIVMHRHGYCVNRQNHHDIFLMLKTIAPNLPAYAMKFASFYYLGDPHFPQMELDTWCAENNKPMHEAPKEILRAYNEHDVTQTVNLFCMAWEVVTRDEFWNPYLQDMAMGEPLLEMETEGGLFLDARRIWKGLQRLQKRQGKLTKRAIKLTGGIVKNPNSSQQLAHYLRHYDNVELKLTDKSIETGEENFCVKKSVLVGLRDTNKLADCAFRMREIGGTLKYYENYLRALEDTTYHESMGENWIPMQVSVSSARTRRFTSSSLYKLNFQNPNEEAKKVHIIPEGEVGFWIDATQIENIVHIYESKDWLRRKAYEADPDWNEYVWLCNQVLGTNKTKEELDDKVHSMSPQIPNWTIYKQYKTGKLGINFGMGIDLFCNLFGLSRDVGMTTFQHIHDACPAIKELQQRVAYDLRTVGYVEDAFGKRYSGPSRLSYKVVAYMIQGCGTGSLPKAQIRANWRSLRSYDKYMKRSEGKCGVMCATTHDENGGRIKLSLGSDRILQLLQKLMYNMTAKFSPLFDDIPLRAKLKLSRTTEAAAEEVDITDLNTIAKYIEQ